MTDTPVDYSVFWYTYSSIAQTLASAFGFLTAVALYQIQQLKQEHKKWTGESSATPDRGEDESDEDYESRKISYQGEAVLTANQCWEHHKVLAFALENTLYSTAVTVGWSLFFMSVTNKHMMSDLRLCYLFLFIAVLAALFNLVAYVNYALVATSSGDIKNLEKFWNRFEMSTLRKQAAKLFLRMKTRLRRSNQ